MVRQGNVTAVVRHVVVADKAATLQGPTLPEEPVPSTWSLPSDRLQMVISSGSMSQPSLCRRCGSFDSSPRLSSDLRSRQSLDIGE